ncbi:MAG: low molecular weight phosphotyrosine protein phosphatase [Alistipes sp.]|nr:low molecular weight phosphotyrosine protein phosphatase [Alistipes sp.]
MKQRILFVCLGNICRSPAAEAVMQQLIDRNGVGDRVEVDSAGTYGGHAGDRADSRMRRAASARGVDITHRSRQVREEDFERFDIIVAMDDNNYEALFRLAPHREAQMKIFRFRDFLRHHPDWSYIPDPYYEGHEGFELVLDLVEDGCQTMLDKILRGEDFE